MTTVTRTNATMAHASSTKPTKAHGANPPLLYVNNVAGVGRYSYIYFSQPLPQDAILDSAVLQVYTAVTVAGAHTVTAERITGPWAASKVTWNTKPAVTATDAATDVKTAPAKFSLWSFDVLNQLQIYGTGTPWYGFRLSSSSNTTLSLYGKSSTRAPVLVVTYHLQTDPPNDLSPGTFDTTETVYVSTSKPTLKASWDADIPLASVRMQLSTAETPNWSTPTWDSGDIAATEPELRISTIGAASAPAVSGFMWWRTQFKGSDSTYTGWSSAARYYYLPQGTLAITTPAISPNHKVTASTTPISWTLTGRVQKSFQVLIEDPSSISKIPLWDSGQQISTNTSVGVPEGVLKKVGHTYKVTVKVWDVHPRQSANTATASFPTHVELSRDFTYELSGAVAAPTSLVSLPLDPKPIMKLTWQSAIAPDFFEVVRDGEVIATDLDPSELLVSGTTYTYQDKTAAPDTHTWEVRSIIGEVTSLSSNTITDDFATGLLWISDMENDIHVAIAGEAPATLGLVEQGATFDPINSKYSVRVTGALGRHKGVVNGKLCGECMNDGTTSAQLQTQILEFREEVGKIFYLHLERLAIPVVIYDVSTYPLYGVEFGKVYGVEFNFHEVKGY